MRGTYQGKDNRENRENLLYGHLMYQTGTELNG